MAFTFGFYNSVNSDRKYDAVQLSSIFDGIIKDGVFMSIGGTFFVSVSSGMTVLVASGRAWFNHTWCLNDAAMPIVIPQSEVLQDRIDTIVLDINANQNVRTNSVMVVKGTPSATSPVRPTLINTVDHHQYPLCDVRVNRGVNEIRVADITNRVGTSDTPFVTGILETVDINDLLVQWRGQFDDWVHMLEDLLDENVAANLAAAIVNHTNDKVTKDGGVHGVKYEGGVLSIFHNDEWRPFVKSTPDNNISIGNNAAMNLNGDRNVAIGSDSLSASIEAPTGENVAMGDHALSGTLTNEPIRHNYSTAVGANAMRFGRYRWGNTAIGYSALSLSTSTDFGRDNIAIGRGAIGDGGGNQALTPASSIGQGNIAIGYQAWGGTFTRDTGNYNIAIGYLAQGGDSMLPAGLDNAIAIGANSRVTASNQIQLGNSQITSLRCQVTTITSSSDERIKEDVHPADVERCLDTVNALCVSRYKYRDFTGTHLDKHVSGFLAGDVEAVFPKAVQEFDEWYDVLDDEGNVVYEETEDGEKRPKKFLMEKVKHITMTEAIPTAWGAIQCLSKMVTELREEVAELRKELRKEKAM